MQYCSKCGTVLEDDSMFCQTCGNRVSDVKETEIHNQGIGQTQKKNKRIGIVVAVIAVLLVGGFFAYKIITKQRLEEERLKAEIERQQSIALFISENKELYDLIKDTNSDFNTIAYMYELAVEMDGGLLSNDFLVSYSESLCASEIGNAKNAKKKIENQKNEIQDCKEEEIRELKDSVEELYSNYLSYYDLLINRSFSVYNFKTLNADKQITFNDSCDEAAKLLSDLMEKYPLDDAEDKK